MGRWVILVKDIGVLGEDTPVAKQWFAGIAPAGACLERHRAADAANARGKSRIHASG
jgi:hypothetical protein